MQRIDVLLAVCNGAERFIVPVELKATAADGSHARQIERYVDWLDQYYLPNQPGTVAPVLIAKRHDKKSSAGYCELGSACDQFRASYPACEPIRYIEYAVEGKELIFEEIAL